MIRSYHLGAPMWSNGQWRGSLFRAKCATTKYLHEYASVFNTVEGNNTFYQLPGAETVVRWDRETPDEFRFCFKFPKSVTHENGLRGAALDEARRFLRVIEPLQAKLGVLFLQLPPSFNRQEFGTLQEFLGQLDCPHPLAIEVRHLDYYRNDAFEAEYTAWLRESGLNYAIFDTGTLHAIDSDEVHVREAQRKKPKMPQRWTCTGDYPWVRYVGHEEVEPNDDNLSRLAVTVSEWIAEGKTPYVFLHSPGDRYVPELCRRFHRHLAKWADVGIVPAFHGESEGAEPTQLDLL